MQALARSIQVIERSDDLRQVTDALRAFAAPYGYDRFAVYAAAAKAQDVIAQLYWIEGDWSGTGEAVDAETYLRRCPVNQHIFETEAAFFWTKTGDSYHLSANPRGPGLHGLQVPVFGAAGLKGAVSFGGNRIDASVPVRLALAALATAGFDAMDRLERIVSRTGPARLSPREREVMRWIAAGKKQADAAALLGLSERTVENHLRRIRHRLGAATTPEALRIALASGEIPA